MESCKSKALTVNYNYQNLLIPDRLLYTGGIVFQQKLRINRNLAPKVISRSPMNFTCQDWNNTQGDLGPDHHRLNSRGINPSEGPNMIR